MTVDHINDKPNEKAFGKIAGRLHLRFYEDILNRYYISAMDALADSFDYILVIRGEYTPAGAIRYLREKNPRAKMILYMWDSMQYNHGIENKWPLFDKVYTFDRADYLAHQDQIGFIPLFYQEEHIHMDKTYEQKYDIAFIGTAHGDRPRIIKEVEQQCDLLGLKMYKFLYCPGTIMYYYNKLFNKDYRTIKKQDLAFAMMPQKQIYEIYKQSGCVLDVEIGSQTGLTMRTIDTHGLRKKMMTTNPDIVHYDFYDENNICVIDRHHVRIDEAFLKKPYHVLDEALYQKYSMESWLFRLLG